MAGSDSVFLARAVSSTGALGSLACALLDASAVDDAARTLQRPFNLNFFCHTLTPPTPADVQRWMAFLRPHYERLGLDIAHAPEARLRLPFNEQVCTAVEEIAPEVVSFHFGLPAPDLVARLKRRGITILSSATSLQEARWLEAHGCDAIIAQGLEAGGHRAMFLEADLATQVGLFPLLSQIVGAVSVPVIAAGGIANAQGIAAALTLGAAGVQLGTAYLRCPEANTSSLYRQALQNATETGTVITNLFSGRPARGIRNRFLAEAGPVSDAAPPFPYAATLIAPLRAASEKAGSTGYMQLWAGQSAALAEALPAAELTRKLAEEALSRL